MVRPPAAGGGTPPTTAAATAWLQAIEEATKCLRQERNNNGGRSTSNIAIGGGEPSQELVESMAYLTQLEAWILAVPEEVWHSPPNVKPPSFVSPTGDLDPSNFHRPDVTLPSSLIPSQAVNTTNRRPYFTSNNPFASIADSDDESKEEEEEEEEKREDDEDEAGDRPVLHQPSMDGKMTLLRLLIRIRTSTSDLWAFQSKALADAHAWTEACVGLVNAITKSREAMSLADSQISRYYFQREQEEQYHNSSNNDNSNASRQQLEALQLDADIVHVAVQAVVQGKDRYHELAQRQISRLERILRPQWESRDQVRDRIGQSRWTNNPSPKHDYSVLREESEQELRRLQEALASLDEADVDALATLASVMKSRLKDGAGHRYNGERPEELMPYGPVNRLEGFPDPTEYGWTFTGSSAVSCVEFFEKVGEDNKLMKLDWFYTTATIKTSLDHPRQGKTQMFAKAGVTPELFRQILENPRVHTDVQRYQRKPASKNQTNRNGRGRGRGSGRRGPDPRSM